MPGHMSVYRFKDSRALDADVMDRCVWQSDLEDEDNDEFDDQDPELLAEIEAQSGLGWTHDRCITALVGANDRSGEGLDRRFHNLSGAEEEVV